MPSSALTVVPSGGRRAPIAPPAISGELVRSRLTELLAQRWQATVTALVAGAGFGKSTALAQAVRSNQVHPCGIDVWVSCEPGDEDADHFAAAILSALGAPLGGHDGAAAIAHALGDLSPVPVCVVVDDVHRLPERSSSMKLLGELLGRLPPHAHLVFASRHTLPLPLARLRAADAVVDINEDTLAYTVDETNVLAGQRGHDPAALEDLAGWPALVHLALVAPPGAPRQFLWEEVVAGLGPNDRAALLALAALGTADARSLTELCAEPVDVDHLVNTIPLVVHTGNGDVRAHDLWNTTLPTIVPAEELGAVSRAACAHLLALGADRRAGSLAARIGDVDALCQASLTLVRNTMSALPVDIAAAWLRAAPIDERHRPELLLLDAALRHADSNLDAGVSRLLDASLVGFRERGDARGEHVALALRLVVAHSRGDLGTVMEVTASVENLPESDLDPALLALAPAAAATEAILLGDVDRGAEILDGLSLSGVPSTLAEAIMRLHWHLLVQAGRAEDAMRVGGEVLAQASTPNAPLFEALARWLSGDPSGFDGAVPDGLDAYEGRGTAALPYARDWFNHGIFTAMVWASAGDASVVARALHLAASSNLDTTTGRNGAPVAVARAALAVVHHDDAGADAAISAFVADHPLDDPTSDVALRRFLAIPYVCSAEARQRWDSQRLGPSHRLQRDVARAFVAARAGEVGDAASLPPPPAVYTALPLPWSIELAARTSAAGNPAGRALAQWLVDRHPAPARRELQRARSSAESTLRRAADELWRSISFPPDVSTRLEVLGPLRILVDGRLVERPEQRRARVRELLAVLVTSGTVGRHRALDLLWPDHSPDDAARNLRVTLTHLRRLLEPDRARGERAYHLRVEGDHLELVASSHLSVDLWEVRRHLQAATSARAERDPANQARHLAVAVELWRGDPLRDLDRIPDLRVEVDQLRIQLVDAALTLGELRLSEGTPALALSCAERALSVDPYDERAFRLVIAAHLQRGDRVQAVFAGQRTRAALDELGVEPAPETAILLRGVGGLDPAPR